MTAFSLIEQKVSDLKGDAESFYTKNNKAAGTRLRVGLQELKVLCQDARIDVSEKKNS